MDAMKTLTINDVPYEIVDETARAQISNKQDRLDVPSWVASTLPSNTAWHTVAYGNGMYVAITNDSNITAYSTDGINWTETTNLPSESDWRSIVYGDGKFVAIAYGTAGAYSTDGINWTPITFSVSRNRSSVTYGNGTFVAICASSTAVSYSTDGINWSESTLPSAGSWQSVTYGNGVFVAVVNSSDAAAYSTDGITWTATTLPSNTRWRSVAYGNGMFVVVATNVNTAAYSTDGINWSETTLPTKASWYSVIYGNGMFVAVAYNSAVSMYSIDGINWTEAELPYKTYWYSVAYGPVGFVAIGFSSDKAAYAKTTEVFAARIDSDAIPVTSVNGKTGAVQLNADEVSAAPVTHEHSAEDITSGAFSENVLPTVPVTKGGTGATDAATARTNLEITPANIGAVQSVATYYPPATAKSADDLTDSFALIPVSAEINADLFNIFSGTFVYVHTSFYIEVSTTARRMQIATTYNSANPKMAMRIYGANGWLPWREIADTNYALNKAGDTMTGNLHIKRDKPTLYVEDTTSGRDSRIQNSAELTWIQNLLDNEHYTGLMLGKETQTMEKLLRLQQRNGDTTNTYSVIHEGNKNLITPADIGAASTEYVDSKSRPVVTTAGTGAAFTATVSGIDSLTAGVSFLMVPHTASTSKTATLNVNGLGAKSLKRHTSNVSSTLANGYADSWLSAGTPVEVIYNGTYWIVQGMTQTNPYDLSTAVPITKGGTGATTAAQALQNLGITYGEDNLEAGTSELTTGAIYLVYE